jgi:hypothetical protein
MYKVISFGHRCSSASFIQMLDVKKESYPFDWLVSKLDVIQDCIETNFVNFLDKNNYIIQNTKTFNLIDDQKYDICEESSQINTFYETNKNNIQTYNFKLALTHRQFINDDDDEYYKRCINRLYDLFKTDIKKYYLYFHPIIGINDFSNNKEEILKTFEDFNKYIITKTENIFGIYFILVKHNNNCKSIKIIETSSYNVFLLHCNEDFIDGGGPFMGNNDSEKEEILKILKTIFPLESQLPLQVAASVDVQVPLQRSLQVPIKRPIRRPIIVNQIKRLSFQKMQKRFKMFN